MANQNSTSPRTVGAIDRASTVLKLFVETNEVSLGVTQIATQLGLSKAVIHRVLTSLREADFIEIDPDSRRYMLGPGALALGVAYLSRQDFRDRARPHLASLSKHTRETATLSIRRADVRVYIDQITPPREVKMTVEIGQQYPLHAGSSSKAFLAFLPADEREVYLRDHSLVALTGATITNATALRKVLDLVQKRGYAISLGERQAGAASIAAPVFDHEHKPIGVISVCGPLERFRPEINDTVEVLLEETRALSRKLGFK